jgi:hypothetical protein
MPLLEGMKKTYEWINTQVKERQMENLKAN